MSLEFNRRSFLKYSAAAAVVVAGSSLLTGCGEDEYQPTGTLGSTLKLMGEYKLKTAKLMDHTSTSTELASISSDTTNPSTCNLVCPLTMTCTSKYGIRLVQENFEVEVLRNSKVIDSYRAGNTDGTGDVSLSKGTNYLKKDTTLETVLTVSGIKLCDGDTVKVKFWPRPQASEGSTAYTRAYCTWTLKIDSSVTTGDNHFVK